MKQAEFRFDLQIASEDPIATLRGLEAKLRATKGISSVTTRASDYIVELTLDASFEDGEQAKKLHRKVMRSIMSHGGVTISRVATTLTDIF
jgi:uncharacterized protein YegP (UPF0339 family)